MYWTQASHVQPEKSHLCVTKRNVTAHTNAGLVGIVAEMALFELSSRPLTAATPAISASKRFESYDELY